MKQTAPPAVHWLFPGEDVTPAPPSEAGAFFDSLSNADRQLLILTLGCGLDLGRAAWVAKLDPSLAHFRLLDAYRRHPTTSPAQLERGVHAMLHADEQTVGPRTVARQLSRTPDDLRARLDSVRRGERGSEDAERRRAGLGVGSLVLILSAVAAFLVFGAVRDTNPLARGQALVRIGEFARARSSFQELGRWPEARSWVAITWLCEGEIDRAMEVLADDETALRLGAFRPVDEELQSLEIDPASGAWLPRGLLSLDSPQFVYAATARGELILEGQSVLDPTVEYRTVRLSLPATADAVAVFDWPGDRRGLPEGQYVWSVPGSEEHPGVFTVLSREQRVESRRRSWPRLFGYLPPTATNFLRGNYLLRTRLYTQALQLFADLAVRYPDQEHPRKMVERISAALGVDPSIVLR